MAARILANLLVMGSGIMVRAFAQAYRQALANASKSGVAHETVQNIRRGSKMISEPEARQILGITEHSTWEEILQKYDKLFENNAKNGSFYLQSKVHRAKECLEEVYQKKAEGNVASSMPLMVKSQRTTSIDLTVNPLDQTASVETNRLTSVNLK
ncbi:hypothetical protein DKX38_018886 [Salix brachista]|uniref:Uncharacterized protein n=2 Tax=Salix TaxID=40685 RepID=A0A5N5KQ25_9ROSI|nr:hypothetical protein DKX38_018886 [Salix brachista]